MIDRHVRITSYLEKYSNGNTHLKENKWGEKIKAERKLKARKGAGKLKGKKTLLTHEKKENNYLASLGNRKDQRKHN